MEETPPLILRLSSTHAKLERGIERYSQVIGERPWQITTSSRPKSKVKGSYDNRYRKNNVRKPHEMEANEPLDLSTRKETPEKLRRHDEPPREVDTSQGTYADIAKTPPTSPSNVTGLTGTQV